MSAQHADTKFARKLAFVLLVSLLLFEYAEVIVGGFSFFFRDFAIFSYPNAFYIRESFLKGEVPLWNPLNEFGIPFLAQWNTMVLYPFNLLFFIFPPEWGTSVFPIFHLILGGVGMYCLVKYLVKNEVAAFLIALGYEFNGITINSLMWTNNSAAFGWMPWCIVSALRAIASRRRRNMIYSVIISSIQVLTGAPEIIAFTWIIIILFTLVEFFKTGEKLNSIKTFACIIIGAIVLTASQLLPFVHLLSHSHRITLGGDMSWSLKSLLCLVAPFYDSFEWSYGVIFQKDQYWTSSVYIPTGLVWLGIIGALLSRSNRKWLLIFLSLIGVLFSLGDNFFAYSLVKKIFPFLEMIRFPIKFIVLYMVSILLLAGYGFKSVIENENHRKKFFALMVYGVLLFLLATAAIISLNAPGAGLPKNVIIKNLILRCIFLTSFVSIFYFYRKKMELNYFFLILAMVLLFLDFKTHAPRQNPVVENWVYERDLLKTERPNGFNKGRVLTRHDKDFYKFNQIKNDAVNDVLSKRLGLYSNLNLLEGLTKLTGMFSLHLSETKIILDKIYEDEDRIPDGLADFLGIKWVPVEGKQYVWKSRQSAIPLVSTGQKIIFLNQMQCLETIFSSNFNSQAIVCLPLDSKYTVQNCEPSEAHVEILETTSHKLKAKVTCKSASTVVFAMAYYPRWYATIDGSKSEIYKANFGFQAIIVPPGVHIVEFIYMDKLFIAGLFISIISSLSLFYFLKPSEIRFGKSMMMY